MLLAPNDHNVKFLATIQNFHNVLENIFLLLLMKNIFQHLMLLLSTSAHTASKLAGTLATFPQVSKLSSSLLQVYKLEESLSAAWVIMLVLCLLMIMLLQ